MIGAALREGWTLPIFIQGDHCQVNAKKYQADPKGEVEEVKKLIAEEVGAGFYNIDVDTSTLVDLSKATLLEQQRLNFEHAAEITAFIREVEPEGISVSVGAEIGEVGHKNSTVEELRAFMDGYTAAIRRVGDIEGISKISVQTGTSHGGVVLPDGSIAKVKLDLEALAALSKAARDEYGMSGAVQHGASTLPPDAFGNFARLETAEIHLATNFQSIVFDHPALPEVLRREMYDWLDANAESERKAGDTPEQFYYKARKKAIGPFKRAGLGPAGGHPCRDRGGAGEDLRLPVRSAQGGRHRRAGAPVREGALPGPRDAPAGAGHGGGRRGSGGIAMARDDERDVIYVEREDSSLKPILFGALLGLAAGLLFAPQSGEETRRALQRRLRRARAMAEEKVSELSERLEERREAAADAETARDEVRSDLERRLAEARARRQAMPDDDLDEEEEPVA